MMADDPKPYFERHVFCCVNTRPKGHPRGSCADKGAADLRNYMKEQAAQAGLERVRVNAAMCLDRCELGPAMVVYPEGVWYRCETRGDVDEIVEAHLKNGGRVERLMLRPEDKELGDLLSRAKSEG